MEASSSNKKISKVKIKQNYCKYCKKTVIGNAYKFKRHLFKHDAVKARYNCDICLKKFFRSDAFKIHMNHHNGVAPQKMYTCDHCERTFVIKNNLISHLKRIHDENIDSELGKFVCDVCKLSFCEQRTLTRHIIKMHFNNKSKDPLHIRKSINETWVEKVNNKNALVSMTKVNTNVIIIKQLKVDVKVLDETNIVECKTDSNDQYSKAVCDYCKKEMVKKSLRTHIKEVHMDIRKFNCKSETNCHPHHATVHEL
ncbi:zinc finger imprinted 3 [Bicyclus anynana]|uniref:Zinc finger imprinted 3 n=1 Tax=Bicyclus anynana TaxID=110368 RepID=A0ABM3M3F5_BICAN|nr:zinc finger imprinted 3 [Bicyclus anynana]